MFLKIIYILLQIVNEGALQLLVNMLKYNDTEEQFAASQCVWNLAFGTEARKAIVAEPECVDRLTKLSESSPDKKVKEAATGALWVIFDKAIEEHKDRKGKLKSYY